MSVPLKTDIEALLESISLDIKHSQRWCCFTCGKPAQNIVTSYINWAESSRVLVSAYQICSLNSICYNDIQRRIVLHTAVNNPTVTFKGTLNDDKRSRTCANCDSDSLASTEKKEDGEVKEQAEAPRSDALVDQAPLNRCSKCRLTRYCGEKCQNADWKRHKQVCKMIKCTSYNGFYTVPVPYPRSVLI